MRKIIFLVFIGFFLLEGMNTYAQGRVGLKAGFNLPGLGEPFMNEGFSSKMRGTYALTYDHNFGEFFGLRAHLEYSEVVRKSGKFQGFYIPKVFGQQLPEFGGISTAYAEMDSEITDKYYLLPIMANLGYNFNEKIYNGVREEYMRVYVSGGGFVGFLSESRQKLRRLRSDVYADPEGEHMIVERSLIGDFPKKSFNMARDHYDRFTYGLVGYIGWEYNFFYHNAIYFELGGNYGLKNNAKEPINGDVFFRSLSFTFGYKWEI